MTRQMLYFLLLSLVASAYAFAVDGGVISGTPVSDVVSSLGPPYFAALWASEDARKTGYWPARHYDLVLWLASIVALPHYILKTKGRSGIGLALAVLILLLLPTFASSAGIALYEDLPDLRW